VISVAGDGVVANRPAGRMPASTVVFVAGSYHAPAGDE
jgi:hypothetical protein